MHHALSSGRQIRLSLGLHTVEFDRTFAAKLIRHSKPI